MLLGHQLNASDDGRSRHTIRREPHASFLFAPFSALAPIPVLKFSPLSTSTLCFLVPEATMEGIVRKAAIGAAAIVGMKYLDAKLDLHHDMVLLKATIMGKIM
jgi:hypothetical protein